MGKVFNRLGWPPRKTTESQKVCRYWRSGRCNRFPCPYLHGELPQMSNNGTAALKRPYGVRAAGANNVSTPKPNPNANSNKRLHGVPAASAKNISTSKPNPNLNSDKQLSSNPKANSDKRLHAAATKNVSTSESNPNLNSEKQSSSNPIVKSDKQSCSKLESGAPSKTAPQKNKTQDQCCQDWMVGKCPHGDNCKYHHQWFLSDSFSLLTPLAGHEKGVNAIAFPLGSDKLYSGSKDETVRVWDCHTGQCAATANLGGEIGCMFTEGPWVFAGSPNVVKAWNTETKAELSLSGPVGQVYAFEVGNEMLFAGTQDGNIVAWRFSAVNNSFEPAATLKGHNGAVLSLIVGNNILYSGSMDHTVRAWDLETLQCLQVLTGHKDAVMSVLCWDQFLLSSSLDQTIKVWAATEGGTLEVIYTHKEEHGVLSLFGMHDAEVKPVLMCSCNDNILRLYDLPSFRERGRIFSKAEIRAIQIGIGGLFFTGDGAGELKVWKWSQ